MKLPLKWIERETEPSFLSTKVIILESRDVVDVVSYSVIFVLNFRWYVNENGVMNEGILLVLD